MAYMFEFRQQTWFSHCQFFLINKFLDANFGMSVRVEHSWIDVTRYEFILGNVDEKMKCWESEVFKMEQHWNNNTFTG